MLCYLYEAPKYFIYSVDVPALLYYAQIPAVIVALLVSFYIFWHDRKSVLNQLLLVISLLFSGWVLGTLIAWTNISADFIAFIWSFFGVALGLISIFSIYFTYVFLEKKDVSGRIKLTFLGLLAPLFVLAPTNWNLSGFDLAYCDAFNYEWLPFKVYGTVLGFLAMVWIFILLVRKYKAVKGRIKRQVLLMGLGLELFLFSFFGMEFVGTYLARIGILESSELELYGLFGMMVFMIYIIILVVRYKAFNAKLFAVQALIGGLVVLIGSQFFFIKTQINFILNGIGFFAALVIGTLLVRSVVQEIKQKEQLAKLNKELKNVIQQRESLVHLITHKVKGSFTRTKYIFSEMLAGSFGDLPADAKKMAERGFEFDKGGIKTIDLVLNASNLESGIIKYDMQKMDFKEVVDSVVEEKAIQAKNRGLELKTDIKDGQYMVFGDSFWLKEVVNNLVDNSIKYTKKGSISVSLSRDNGNINLSVVDTGVGITPEDMKNLFTEGGRGKESIKMNVDSTGYGLYSVKLIMDAHGGRVWAESEGKDKGSQMYVEIHSL